MIFTRDIPCPSSRVSAATSCVGVVRGEATRAVERHRLADGAEQPVQRQAEQPRLEVPQGAVDAPTGPSPPIPGRPMLRSALTIAVHAARRHGGAPDDAAAASKPLTTAAQAGDP